MAHGDKLSLALAQPFAVQGGQITLKSGTGISAAEAGRRTNRIEFVETTLPLSTAKRAPELHLGYLHEFNAGDWGDAWLAFGGIARLDGGAKMAAVQAALNLRF